jgi:hypothetical protein
VLWDALIGPHGNLNWRLAHFSRWTWQIDRPMKSIIISPDSFCAHTNNGENETIHSFGGHDILTSVDGECRRSSLSIYLIIMSRVFAPHLRAAHAKSCMRRSLD